jgi:hypothetical protein
VFRIFLLAALAVMLVLFAATPTERVASSIAGQPLIAGGVGLLTIIVLLFVSLFLVLSICLIPVALLLILICILAVTYGWIGIGLEVGRRLSEMMKWEMHPAVEAGLGTFLFSAVVLGIGLVPLVGWVAPPVAALFALGGVVVSRFGSVTYQFGTPSTAALEPPETAAEEPKKVTRKSKKEE